MKIRTMISLALACCLLTLTSYAAYSFSSPGNGEFYTPSEWAPTFAEPGQNTGEAPIATDATATFDNDYVAPSKGNAVYPDVWTSDTTPTFNRFTLPDAVELADGSLGILSISKISLKAAVYEGDNLETMDRGVGHFSSTSAWEGNIGLCAHNRTGFFGRLKELKVGDVMTYETSLGTRTYQVTYVGQISETDFSYLSRSEGNMLTMITCVENVPSKRLVVRAVETL